MPVEISAFIVLRWFKNGLESLRMRETRTALLGGGWDILRKASQNELKLMSTFPNATKPRCSRGFGEGLNWRGPLIQRHLQQGTSRQRRKRSA